jgi:L-ascorbate metabolism protein UlaG (beta-lactamase superfamily)
MAERHHRHRARLIRRAGVAAGLAFAVACSGHVVHHPPALAPFDFEHPPCDPGARPPAPAAGQEVVEVRYLGAAGLYLRWGDDAVLLGPYFSNPGLLRAGFGRWRADRRAIERGLAGLPISEVEAILAGHSHYDHIGDLPVILDMAPRATLYVNESGARALAYYSTDRVKTLDSAAGWVWLTRGAERRPIRFLSVPSEHAPQVDHHLWASGEVPRPWHEPWTAHRFHDLKAGRTFALVIDLMSRDLRSVLYRLYYQDAASSRDTGVPPRFTGAEEHPYDLAVLCIASYDKVERGPQPASILAALRPRHVLVTHYDDFFRSQDRPVRFVALLTDGKADRYLRAVNEALPDAPAGAGPLRPVCGASGPRWTMPLPGAGVFFSPASER